MTDLQPMIDAVPEGSTLALPTGTYNLVNPINKLLTFASRRGIIPGYRVGAADVDVVIVTPAGLILNVEAIFRGVSLACADPTKNIVQALGPRFRMESGCILGSATAGARRGLAANGDGGTLIDSTIDECWRPDTEGQAVLGWDGCRNWTFTNSYLGGASQSMMFGGGDASTPARVPMNIRVQHCEFGKNRAWLPKAVIKTAFEMKAGLGIHLSDFALQGAGNGQGQHGFLIVLKSCNQDGHAPWSQTSGVLLENFTAKQGAGCVSFVAEDGNSTAVPMGNITLRNGAFTEIDPFLYPGDGRGFQFLNRAMTPTRREAILSDITLENITVAAKNMQTSMYFIGPPPVRMILRNIQLPQSQYGVKIDAGPSFKTPAEIMTGLKAWAPDAIVEGITVV